MKEPYLPRFPLHMVWCVTNVCNAKCIHCSSASGRRLPGELNTEEALDLIAQLWNNGCFDLALSGGEPLLRPDIESLIAHAAGLGMKVGLGSNGWPVTAAKAQRLKSLGLARLQISLDGIGPTHDEIRGINGLYDRAIAAVEHSMAAGLTTHVCFTPHRRNLHQLEEAIDTAARMGVHLFNLSQFVPVGRGNQAMDLSAMEWRTVARLWAAKRREYEGHMRFTSHLAQMALVDPTLTACGGFRGCQAGVAQGCISPDGTVTPCVMLPVPVGNVREMPLRQIWDEAPELRQLRERQNLGGMCATCTVRDQCGGCRGVAFSYTGDFLAEDPHCWLIAAKNQAETERVGP